jgi:drug/metabolite transporter (DMT)-like permease
MLNKALFFALALFWGGSFVAIKYLINDVPSFTAAFYRVFFAVIFLSLIYSRSIKIPKGFFGKELLYSLLAGMFSIGIPFGLLFWGERYISASLAGVLNGTVPFWTLLIGIIFLNQINRVSKEKVLGLVTGFIGISLIFGPRIKFDGNILELQGLMAVLLMAISYGIGINLNRAILTKNKIISGPISLISQHIVSALYLGCVALYMDGVPDLTLLLKPDVAISLFYLSFFSTTLAFIIFFKLIKEVGSVEASSVTFFVPAIALIIDILIFGHSLSILEGLGTVIIFVSMFLLREKKIKAVLPL